MIRPEDSIPGGTSEETKPGQVHSFNVYNLITGHYLYLLEQHVDPLMAEELRGALIFQLGELQRTDEGSQTLGE